MRPWRLASAGRSEHSVVAVLGDEQRVGHGGSSVSGRRANLTATVAAAHASRSGSRRRRSAGRAGAGRVPAAPRLRRDPSNPARIFCYTVRDSKLREEMGWAQPIFFCAQNGCRGRKPATDLRATAGADAAPAGVRAGRLGDVAAGAGSSASSSTSPKGVDVEDCARVSNHLTRLFAVENVDFDRLEVSSPGLDRPLKKAADFARFAGEEAELRLREPDRQRAQAQGHAARLRRTAPSLRRDRQGHA